MKEVKIKKSDLLKKIKDNRRKHVEEYKAAVEGYKEEALKEVKEGMKKLERQIKNLEKGEMLAIASVHFNLPVPENHEKEYDQAIEMLDMSVDDVLTISYNEFSQYVLDRWEWIERAKFVNSSYIK